MESYMWSFVSGCLSLSITFSRFVWVEACMSTSFFFYGWMILHCMDIPHFVYLLMDIWVVSTCWLLSVVLLWTFLYKFVFEHLFPVLLSIYLGVELLGPMVILCVTVKLFTTVDAPALYGVQLFHILPSTCFAFSFFLFFLILAILVGMNWYLTVLLICIFLMTNDIEHLFLCFLAALLLLS